MLSPPELWTLDLPLIRYTFIPPMAISEIRIEYNLIADLRRSDFDSAPIVQFHSWFDQAVGARTSSRVRRLLINLNKSLLDLGIPGRIDVNAASLANRAS